MLSLIVCVDVDYRPRATVAACVGFRRWADDAPTFERSATLAGAPAPYVPGQFYLRELPALLAVLRKAPDTRTVVIDGYVSLGPGRPGLGEHLHRAIGAIVVGIAKTEFRGALGAPVLRGTSRKPLFVTAIGMSLTDAANGVLAMHGAHRIPTLVRRADRLCREV